MTDTSMIFTKERPLTIGTDDFGSYGTIFAPDSDHEVPNPDESTTQLSPSTTAPTTSKAVSAQSNRRSFRHQDL
jgi:hypothetical protein